MTEDDKKTINELTEEKIDLQMRIQSIEGAISDIDYSIFEIVGNCPLCKNSHYPFCGPDNTKVDTCEYCGKAFGGIDTHNYEGGGTCIPF